MDTELCLTVDGDIKRLSMTKSKDGELLPDMGFKLNKVNTDWLDDDGEIVSSAVLSLENADLPDKQVTGKPPKLKTADLNVFSALSKCIEKHGIDTPITVKLK
jgi:hypothetical protein